MHIFFCFSQILFFIKAVDLSEYSGADAWFTKCIGLIPNYEKVKIIFKGTVREMLRDLQFKDGDVRLTTVSLKSLSDQ